MNIAELSDEDRRIMEEVLTKLTEIDNLIYPLSQEYGTKHPLLWATYKTRNALGDAVTALLDSQSDSVRGGISEYRVISRIMEALPSFMEAFGVDGRGFIDRYLRMMPNLSLEPARPSWKEEERNGDNGDADTNGREDDIPW